jgi:patatin-related protein
LRSLADIPRQQPINDALATIQGLSARVRRLRQVTDGMAADVDAAIEAAVGRRFFLFGLSAERLGVLRSKGQTAAAAAAGFSYAAYGQLKLARLIETLADSLSGLGAGPVEAVRRALAASLAAQGLDNPSQAATKQGATSPWVVFLRRFDLEFRIRRLRFCIRRINAITAGAEAAERAILERVKAGLYVALEAHMARRLPGWLTAQAALVAVAPQTLARPEAALEALADALDLRTLDAETDARLAALFDAPMPRPLRRQLLNSYLGFPFYDIATLALLAGDGSDEFDEIKVDRMAPEDAGSLSAYGGTRLKGARLNAFGAFFSRGYREHDYLWGRLHAAERLIDIVASAAPHRPDGLERLKAQAGLAILAAEAPHLSQMATLIETLRGVLAAVAAGAAMPVEDPGAEAQLSDSRGADGGL